MYMIAVIVLATFALYKALRPFHLSLTGALPSGVQPKALYLTAWWWLLGFAILLPFALSAFESTMLSIGKPVFFLGSSTVPVLISSLVAITVAGVVSLKMWSDYRLCRCASFGSVSVHVVVVLAGVLLGIAGFKHVQFADSNAGWTYATAVKDLEELSDIDCAANLVIVRWSVLDSAATPVRYRCPTGIILGRFTQVPFVPWPDYQEGDSLQLARSFSELTSATDSAPPTNDAQL